MAITQLGLYNKALVRVGETVLTALTDERPSRYSLDAVWNLNAVNRCLEMVMPKFATTTSEITGTATATNVTLAFTHTIPADYITEVGVYSDTELDQDVSRYIVEGSTLLCDYETIYLRYVTSTVSVADFTAGFADVVALYLAKDICYQFDPQRYEGIAAELQASIDNVTGIELSKEPGKRPKTDAGTFGEDWRSVYNDALLVLGEDKLPANTTDHPFRVMIDTSVSGGVVAAVLEDSEWQFGTTSTKIGYNNAIDPEWGYNYVFDKPDDLHRLAGVFVDEDMSRPLRDYADEDGYYMAHYNTIYVKYVSSDFVSQPTSWTDTFRRLVAAKIAYDIAAGVVKYNSRLGYPVNPQLVTLAGSIYDERKSQAQNSNAMQSPPQKIAGGDWIDSRFRYSRYGRGRP